METTDRLADPSRLAALRDVLDGDLDSQNTFDRLTRIAAQTLEVPIAQVNIVTADRQISISSEGPSPSWKGRQSTSLDRSYCKHVVESGAPLVVENSEAHPLVRDNSATTEEGIRAYAAVPLTSEDDQVVGTLCVVDFKPRSWSSNELSLLADLGTFVVDEVRKRIRAKNEIARLAALVEASEDGIFSIDLDGMIKSWNLGAEKLSGIPREAAIGKSLDILIDDSVELDFSSVMDRVRTGDRIRWEIENSTPELKSQHVKVSCSPSRNSDGTLIGATVLAQDVTEKRQIEGELKRSQKMEAVGRLAASIAHDFNNLLTALKGGTQLLLLDHGLDGDSLTELEEMDSTINRAAQLTKNLLTFTRGGIVSPEVFDLGTLVRESEGLLERLTGKGVHLDLTSADGVPVRADRTQVEQVLVNLAANARDAMAGEGTLSIECARFEASERFVASHGDIESGKYALLTVTDTGTGMSRDVMDRIFDPFFSTKPGTKGTGLGLSTVWGVVQQVGGTVHVYSEVDRGTVFKVYLPLWERSDERRSVSNRPAVSSKHRGMGEHAHILLVEDDPSVRRALSRFLETAGHNLSVAETGQEALDLAGRLTEPVDLLITDYTLPELTGQQVADALNERWPDLAVLIMSGFSRGSIAPNGWSSQYRYLEKPFGLSVLGDEVSRILRGEGAELPNRGQSLAERG